MKFTIQLLVFGFLCLLGLSQLQAQITLDMDGRDTVVCTAAGLSSITLDATEPGVTDPTDYVWGGNASGTGLTKSPSVPVTSGPKTYTVTIATTSGSITKDLTVEFVSKPAAPTVTSPVYTCKGNVVLNASVGGSSAKLLWYSAATGGYPIGQASPFTYNATSSTTLYAEAVNVGTVNPFQIGEDASLIPITPSNYAWSSATNQGIKFYANASLRLTKTTVWAQFGLGVTIQLKNHLGVVLATKFAPVLTDQPTEIDLGFMVPPSTNFYTLVVSSTNTPLKYKKSATTYPYVNTGMKITGSGFYYYLFNTKYELAGCASARVPVNITVYASPSFTLNDTIICGGTSATLSMGNVGATATYSWKPTNQTTSSITVTPSTATPPTFIGSAVLAHPNGVTCSKTDTMSVMFSTSPTAVTASNSVTACKGKVNITASSSAGAKLLWHDWISGSGNVFLGEGSPLAYNATVTDSVYVRAYNKSNVKLKVGYKGNTGLLSYSSTPYSGLKFDIQTPLVIDSVTIYPQYGGQGIIYLQNSSGVVLDSQVITIPAFTGTYIPHTVALGFVVGKGTGYRLLMGNYSFNRLRTQTQAIYAQAINNYIKITGTYNAGSTTFPYFFDWQVSPLTCETPIKGIKVNVSPSPDLAALRDTFSCSTSPIVLNMDATGGGTYTYSWLDAGTGALLPSGTSQSYTHTTGFKNIKAKVKIGTCADSSVFSAQVFPNISNPTVSPLTTCAGNITLNASTTGTNQIVWWDASTGGNIIGTGSPLPYSVSGSNTSTTNISYYAQAFGVAQDTTNVGPKTPNGFISANNTGLVFSVSTGKAIIIDKVSVYMFSANATINVELRNSAGALLKTKTFSFSGLDPLIERVLALDYFVTEGTDYRLIIKSNTLFMGANTFSIAPNSPGFPYGQNGVFQITGSYNSNNAVVTTRYNNFFNWKVRTVPCSSSGRSALNITVLKSPTSPAIADFVTCSPTTALNAGNAGASTTYLWDIIKNGSAVTPSPTTQIYNVAGVGTYEIKLTVNTTNTGAATCVARDTAFVDVLTSATAVTVPNSVTKCKGNVTFTATTYNTSNQLIWWDAATNGNVLGVGSPATAYMANSTTVYAQAFSISQLQQKLGYLQPSNNAIAVNPTSSGFNVVVGSPNATSPVGGVFLDEVTIYTANAGNVKIELVNASNVVVNTKTILSVAGYLPTIVPLNFFIPKGTYKLRVASFNAGTMLFENIGTAGTFYNTTNPLVNLKEGTNTHVYISGNFNTTTQYTGFYNWKIRTLPITCASARVPMQVIISPSPLESLPSSVISCDANVQLCMTSTGATFTWTVDEYPVGGATTVSNTACKTFTTSSYVIAKAAIGACIYLDTVIVEIGTTAPAPSVNDTTVCPGDVLLNANGNGADYTIWYNAPVGGVQVGGGIPLQYFAVDTLGNTTLYAQSYNLSEINRSTGRKEPGLIPPPVYSSGTGLGEIFDVLSPLIIDSVSVYITTGALSGSIQIQLQKRITEPDNSITIQTLYSKYWSTWTNVRTDANGKKYVRIPLGFFLVPNEAGATYSLLLVSNSIQPGASAPLGYENGISSPYPITVSGSLSINGAIAVNSILTTAYYYFYDWSIRSGICPSATVPLNLSLYNAPTHIVNPFDDFMVTCGDTTLTLGGYPNGFTYSWTPSGNMGNNETISTSNLVGAGVGNLDGCYVWDYVSVTVNPDAIASASYNVNSNTPFNVSFNNAGSSFGTYTWNFGDGTATSNQANPTHTYAQGCSTYIVTLTVTNDCGTDVFTIPVTCTSISEGELKGNISVYPNPAIHTLNVAMKDIQAGKVNLQLYNLMGQTLIQKQIVMSSKDYTETLSIKDIATGVYFLRIDDGDAAQTVKVVIER